MLSNEILRGSILHDHITSHNMYEEDSYEEGGFQMKLFIFIGLHLKQKYVLYYNFRFK